MNIISFISQQIQACYHKGLPFISNIRGKLKHWSVSVCSYIPYFSPAIKYLFVNKNENKKNKVLVSYKKLNEFEIEEVSIKYGRFDEIGNDSLKLIFIYLEKDVKTIKSIQLVNKAFNNLFKQNHHFFVLLRIEDCPETIINQIRISNPNNQLETVDLSNSTITNQGLLYLLEKCPTLKKLNLNSCKNISNSIFPHLNRLCPNLETLDISGNTENIAIDNQLFIYLPNIRELNLSALFSWGANSSNSPFVNIDKNCPHLMTLKLNGCQDIYSSSLQFITNCQQLQEIHLRGTKLRNENLLSLFKKCSQLEFLDLCLTRITAEGLASALEKTKSVKTIHVYINRYVSSVAIEQLKRKYPTINFILEGRP